MSYPQLGLPEKLIMVTYIVLIIGGIVLVIPLIDGIKRIWFLRSPCRLVTQIMLPDKCLGTCPPGTVCGPTATRPYGPRGWFGTQDAACACAGAAPTGPVTAPTGPVTVPAGPVPAPGNPVTDANRPVAGSSARPMPADVPSQPSQQQQQQDQQRGKELIRRAAKKGNCIGLTFGQGNWELDTTEVPKILADNYGAQVPNGESQVCNVVVYKAPDGSYDHAGLVVEVDANGNPKKVRSKATTSNYVYDHPPNVQPYGNTYEVYERSSTSSLGAAAQAEIRRLRDEYDRMADKSSRAARDLAERLCSKKNALVGSD